VLLAAAILWALLSGEDEGSESSDAAARIVNAAELAAIADNVDGPIYWVGERAGAEIEYEQVADRSYVRYLSGDAEAGDPRPAFLTIATYPLDDPVDALGANARRTGTELQGARGGALVWVNPDRPQSVYLAEPGAEHQVEVYDPLPRRALSVALSGEVVPVP
jgi:hypothetical protein